MQEISMEIDSEKIKASTSSYHTRRLSTQMPATEALLYQGMCILGMSLNTMTEKQVAAYQDSSEIVKRMKTMSIDQLNRNSRKQHRMRDISRVDLDLSMMRDAHATSLSHAHEEYDESFPMIEWTYDESSQEGLADIHPECYRRILFPSSPVRRGSPYGRLLRSKSIESQLGSLESC
jgi:hypothetical protein